MSLWNTYAGVNTPPPASSPNRRGIMKMPDPIINLAAMAVRAARAVHWLGAAVAAGRVAARACTPRR
jgi:hypothetical protein